ncbi:hypothetical protein ACFQL8_15090 [Streptomyces goshikiensis]|uniref:hypothetical protein n=1 Tax=Streptomyces goshikiensis TaxID=1942 RepID=UPI001673B919|nr:hypothetical protein [Streptomyces goshikiensis]GHD75488.1 hypothetical protein GCM10010336_51370 [Streptomyces goshikiensis]
MTAIGEIFFGKVMWQPDMTQVCSRDINPPLHAWAAQGNPSDSASERPTEERPDERPESPSDDDINDSVDCGRQIYYETVCEQCKLL